MVVFNYGLWMSIWCVLGTIIGMKTLEKVMKKIDRQSPLVFMLFIILFLSAVGVLYFGLI